MKVLNMELGEHSYPIIVGRGLLTKANEYFNLDRKVYIISSSFLPVLIKLFHYFAGSSETNAHVLGL